MGSGSAVRLELGVEIEKRVLEKGGTREDIALVLEEAPEFIDSFATNLVERAKTVRGDKDCFRLMNDEIVIEMPALKRPTLEQLRKKESWIRSIERDDSTEEPVTLRLAVVLKSTEGSINGATYERRIAKLRAEGKLLGWQHLNWFVENQHKVPEPLRSAIRSQVGKIYVDFPGLVVVDESGDRGVPYAVSDGEQFVESWGWLVHGFSSDGRVAVSSK